MNLPRTLPDYVRLVCPQHAEALEICDCACTCSDRPHATYCALQFLETPRVVIHKENA